MTVSPAEFLITVAEPTRLRLINCLAAAPLFVSDLVALLDLPQPSVSRHLRVLRELDVVRDIPFPPYVLYRFDPPDDARGRLLRAILDALRADPAYRDASTRAHERSRTGTAQRLAGAAADAP